MAHKAASSQKESHLLNIGDGVDITASFFQFKLLPQGQADGLHQTHAVETNVLSSLTGAVANQTLLVLCVRRVTFDWLQNIA